MIAPHREFGIEIEVVEQNNRALEPVGNRNAGVLYGLGNLIENAVDYARSTVQVTVAHDRGRVSITIEDDGPGYPPDILPRIGEPYMTTRPGESESAGGLGLGLFIAKTLLERSGASIRFGNRPDGQPGARIDVEWPRWIMETDERK